MAARTKKVIISGITDEQMNQAFADFNDADAKIKKINSKLDIEFTKAREKYQDELTKLNSIKASSFELMQAFAVEKRPVLFVKKKSMETIHGVIGFKLGNYSLKTLPKWTWKKVLEELKKKKLSQYIRVKEEAEKEKLLADRNKPEIVKILPTIGLCVQQEETFYVEPKKEEITA